ncbi:MAG: helix-turn-helix domain-containing protein [Acetivibrio ethanolgignens]
MMYTLRLKKGISQEDLCRGLCSVATLCRMEVGERRPDILVFNALLQRLGKNPYIIDTVLTLEEFFYFAKRRNIEISLELKEYERAEKELKELEELWLSETETTLLLLYVYAGEEKEERLILAMKRYIQYKVADGEAKNKRMAQLMYLLAQLKIQQKRWREVYRCCEEVISAEVENGELCLIPQALQMELFCLEQGISEENGELRKKEYQALEKLLLEYGRRILEEKENLIFFIKEYSQEKLLIDELISRARERKEISQEKLRELRRLVILQRYEEAEKLLEEIEAEIDGTAIENRQYLEFYHVAIEKSLGKIDTNV